MSHEIRTPINAVLGMNEMILREGEEAGARVQDKALHETFDNITEYAADVDSAGKSLLAIINDILDFSKIEAGRMDILMQPYRLSSVLNDVCNMILFRARSKKLSFHVLVDEQMPDALDGDEVRIRQIMVNLLNNAVKYTDAGSITLNVKGLLTGEDMIDLIISVSDTGIGIREEDIARLFTKFERVDLNRNNQVEGAGLGLAITSSLVRMMDGTIDVKSEYGKGSVFTVYLPQRVLSQEKIGDFRERIKHHTEEMPHYHESFRAPGVRILAVDDTPVNLTVIEGLLKSTLVLIEKASGGEQALTLAKDTPYDLILMDQRMPGMNGTEAMRHIRAQEGGCNRKTPVICLTADAVQDAKHRYMEEGFTDYLAKPVEGRALEQMLMKYLPKEKVFPVRESARAEAEAVHGSQTVSGVQVDAISVAAESPGMQADAVYVMSQPSMRERYDRVPALHYEDAILYLASDDIITDTLRQFTESIRDNADEIERLWKEGDIENYTIKVHALKSSARMVGLRDLSELAKKLEEAGNKVREAAE